MNGAQADLGRSKREPAPDNPFYPNGTQIVVNPPSAELQTRIPRAAAAGQGHGLHAPLAGVVDSQLARICRSHGRRVRLGQPDHHARRAASAIRLFPDDAAAHHRRRQSASDHAGARRRLRHHRRVVLVPVLRRLRARRCCAPTSSRPITTATSARTGSTATLRRG